jgi:putative oxidoreductase
MTRIELPEDYAQPARVTVGQTLLRIAIGGILLAHAALHLLDLDAWQDELASQFALLEPSTAAQALIAIEVLGGLGLIFGWFTRLSALALMCSVGASIALELAHQEQGQGIDGFKPESFELPAVLAVAALFFLLAGGGPASLDEWLRTRRRRKAIQNDDTWLRHPYVASPDEPSYDEQPAAGYSGYEPQSFDTSDESSRQQEYEDSLNPKLASSTRR